MSARPAGDAITELRDRVVCDEAFQAACQRYAHGNGSSDAIAMAAVRILSPTGGQ